MPVFCTKCGAQNDDLAQTCAQCQSPLPTIAGNQPTYQVPTDYQPGYETGYQPIQPPAAIYGQPPIEDWQRMGADKKIVAGICSRLPNRRHHHVAGLSVELRHARASNAHNRNH